MAVRFGLYEALLVVAAITSVAVATYTWRRREKPGAEFLTLVLVSDACWALVSLVGSLASGDRLALTSAKTVYLFAPVTVAGLFLFALAYTGRKQWLGPRLYGALAIEPLLVNVAVWTSPYHDLFWTIPGPSQTARIGWQISFGPLFKGHVVYSYLLVGIASVWLVQFALKSEHLYQRQVFGLIASLVPPWAGNVLFVSEYIASDPTPVAFAITSITLTWAISRTHVLDIAPIARDAVVDTIGDGVVVLDDSGRIVDTNPTARALFDWPDTLVGAEFVSLLDGRPVTESRVQTLLERREEGTLELQLDGQYYTIDVSPLSDVRGVFLGHVLLVHDVTEQKQRQLELQRRNEQLDRFAGVVSHDLRNPLHVASGTLSLARESHEPEHFDRIERAHERMERLIEDLLTLAKEGEQVAELEPVSLPETARDAWEVAPTSDAALEIDGDLTLEADPTRLQQLLENLYRNSVEHGGDEVTIRVAATEDGFLVEDDGPGIPEGVREAALEPGYTTDSGGAGIGLMVVAHVAEAHGWDLTIADSDSGGACFRFDTLDSGG